MLELLPLNPQTVKPLLLDHLDNMAHPHLFLLSALEDHAESFLVLREPFGRLLELGIIDHGVLLLLTLDMNRGLVWCSVGRIPLPRIPLPRNSKQR